VSEALALGLTLDLAPAKTHLQAVVDRALDAVAVAPTAEGVADACRLVADARAVGLRFGLWGTQNRFFEIWRARLEARATLVPLATELGFKLALEAP